MPIYTFLCDSCGGCTDSVRAVAERDSAPRCETCGSATTRQFLGGFGTVRSRNDSLTIDQMKELKVYKGALAHKRWLESPEVQEDPHWPYGRRDARTQGTHP